MAPNSPGDSPRHRKAGFWRTFWAKLRGGKSVETTGRDVSAPAQGGSAHSLTEIEYSKHLVDEAKKATWSEWFRMIMTMCLDRFWQLLLALPVTVAVLIIALYVQGDPNKWLAVLGVAGGTLGTAAVKRITRGRDK